MRVRKAGLEMMEAPLNNTSKTPCAFGKNQRPEHLQGFHLVHRQRRRIAELGGDHVEKDPVFGRHRRLLVTSVLNLGVFIWVLFILCHLLYVMKNKPIG